MLTPRKLPANPYASQPVEAWLIQLQSSAGLEERYRAFIAVTELLEPARVLDVACQTLADPAGDLRAAAATWIAVALQRQRLLLDAAGTEAVTAALSPLLQDGDPDVQLAAARGLGSLAPQLPALVLTLVTLIDRDDSQPTSQAVLADLCGRVPAVGVQCLTRLRQWLSADQADVREATAAALVRLGAVAVAAIPELVVALDDEEPFVRESAAVALGQVGPLPIDAIEALRVAAADEDEIVAQAAQRSLGAGSP